MEMKLNLVTFVSHNSRISERMVQYNPAGFVKGLDPVLFEGDDLQLMIELVSNSIKKCKVSVKMYNVLPDHVHLLIEAKNLKQLSEAIGKIKGGTSFYFKKEKNWEIEDGPIWAQKFHAHELDGDTEEFQSAFSYIKNNHEKHAERWGRIVFSNGKTHASLLKEKWIELSAQKPTS